LGELTWDVDTGTLAVATSFEPPSERKGEALDRADAIRDARHWLRVLGIAAGQGASWQLVADQGPPASQWRVEWRSSRPASQAACVFVDAQTGDFRSAETWQLPAGADR
jgi:hypothetical protein